ncbi:helix-turn-helix domain-containing protein [Snuella sedimenti]|uniref:Helix-turn-helix transcriptional regulator n=1 Tax=Snuella sedimenti TaxID=2798802 RepID=A0A8J7IGK6_9FLAO|nr:helix-turn-helix transcriptional regulator [Snuella sedimenti]MBJ6367713.1 helix-turn-helix transcriptional regulator [Snuella sedimenti]
MRKYTNSEVELLNIQIGTMVKLARLQKGMSQLDLALLLDSNSTMVGRIERSESVSGWDKILLISQLLDIDFNNLFRLKTKNEMLSIVEESYKLDGKLTNEKKNYYDSLKKVIISKYNSIEQ